MSANPLFDLAGTAALVTGGNGGIGRGIALGLAGAGASVMVAARDAEKSAAVVGELRAVGVRAEAVACDVLDSASIETAVQATVDAFGRLDILVNNAGVAGAVGRSRSRMRSGTEWWTRTCVRCSSAAARRIRT